LTRHHSRGFALAAVLPFALFLLVFAVYPLVQLVRMSLSHVEIQRGQFTWDFVGVDNFTRMLSDQVAQDSVISTAVFILGAVPLTIVLGTVLAILVERAVVLGGLARNVILWPAVVAPVVVSLMWLLILSPSVGALNKLLASLGLPAQGWLGSTWGARWSVIAVDVWHWTPLVFLLIYTAILGIDRELYEAARVEGATEMQVLRYIVLPLLRPALFAAFLIRLVMSIKAFDEMFLLTKGGPGTSTTLVSLHIRNVFFDQLELGYGAAFSVAIVVVTAVMVTVAALVRRLATRREAPAA
jgi:multiple sugar transport system permease protein